MKHSALGFTLIEMIAVIVVLGIVGIGISNFLGLGASVYVDAVGREQVVSQTRFMMERLTREIREALPNSVRVKTSGSVQCVEFVPILASSTYLNVPVAPEAASSTVSLVQHAVAGLDATKIVVYPLTANDVYGTDASIATTGNIFTLATIPSSGTLAENVTLTNVVKFDSDSPTSRYYLVKNAISYCVDSANGQLKRYTNYWPPTTNQQVPPASATGVLMGENIKADTPATIPFNYSSATLVTNAVVQFTFAIVRDDEQIDFHHEVHLVNVP